MKLFAKLMLASLVIAMLLPFTLLKDDSGRPLASLSDIGLPDFSLPGFSLPDMPQISGNEVETAPSESLDGMVLIYKWYDSEGNVQFTSGPPPEGTDYTVKGFDPDANVIQAVRLPVAGDDATDVKSTSDGKSPFDLDNPYSKETIEKLFEDARNVEKLLQERLRQQESAFNQ